MRFAAVAGLAVGSDSRVDGGQHDGGDQAAEVGPPVRSRDLRFDGAHAPVGRRDDQDVAAREAGSPDADAVRIDAVEGLREGDRIAVTLDLSPRVDLVARLALGGPESRVVIDQTSQAGGAEHFGERCDPFLDSREAMGHDHERGAARRPFRPLEPSPQGHCTTGEFDIDTHNDPLRTIRLVMKVRR